MQNILERQIYSLENGISNLSSLWRSSDSSSTIGAINSLKSKISGESSEIDAISMLVRNTVTEIQTEEAQAQALAAAQAAKLKKQSICN